MKFVMPIPPNTGNQRGHWRTRERQKETYWQQLDNLQLVGELPAPPSDALRRVRMTATLYVWNAYDPDGSMALMKYPIDWLRTRGYIVNDTRKNIEWAGLPTQHICRDRNRLSLELEIEAA